MQYQITRVRDAHVESDRVFHELLGIKCKCPHFYKTEDQHKIYSLPKVSYIYNIL